MRWTNETPTKPGWYWLRSEGDFMVVEISTIIGGCLGIDFMGTDAGFELSEFVKYSSPSPPLQWFGPIEPPDESHGIEADVVVGEAMT